MFRAHLLSAGLLASMLGLGSCGGTMQPDGGGSPSGGQSAESGGTESGGTSSGGSESSGGTESGGTSSGGSESSGGSSSGGYGGSVDCGCDRPTVTVCGVDGEEYDAACGSSCVPVDIACEGLCPCLTCGCYEQEETEFCPEQQRTWSCVDIGVYSHDDILAAGCTDAMTMVPRYCCPAAVQPTEFCAD